MQNQLLTEPETEAVYTLPSAAQNELTTPSAPEQNELTTEVADVQTELTAAETQSVQNTQAVHEWLANILQKTRYDKIRFWTILIVLWLVSCLLVFLFVFVSFSRNGNGVPLPFFMSILPWLGTFCLVFARWLQKPKWNAGEIVRVGGTQAVGTLLDLLVKISNRKQRTELCVALSEVLPQMKASNAALLTRRQRRFLYSLLKNGTNPGLDFRLTLRFRLTILKALEQVGDAEAVPIVERMANSKARTAEQKQLKTAAQECLPLLRVNFGTVEANKTLLRASSPALPAPETLLRPSEFVPDANPKQLLHASDTTVPQPPSL